MADSIPPVRNHPLSGEQVLELLTLPEAGDATASLQYELAQYTGLESRQVDERVSTSADKLARQWRSEDRSTLSAQVEFYLNNEEYLYDLTRYNASPQFAQFASAVARFAGSQASLRTVIDFGSGIGSMGLVLASLGYDVVLADVSQPLLDFARWRFHKRGLAARFLNLTQEQPLPGSAQLVSALDTLEHISDLKTVLKQIHGWLAPGGWILFNTFAEEDIRGDSDHPMHLSSGKKIFPLMRPIGFGSRSVFHGLMCYRKAAPSWLPAPFASLGSRAYWSLRFAVRDLLKG